MQNFSNILAGDETLNTLKRRLDDATRDAEETERRICEYRDRIGQSEINVRSLADAIVSGGKAAPLVPVSVLKDELAQLTAYSQAGEIARRKLGEMIEARINELSRDHAQRCTADQCQRTRRILDALLTIAETNKEESLFLAVQAENGAKVHHFGKIAFPIDGTIDVAGLSRVVERYERLIGYKPTDEQQRRLTALQA